MWTHEIMCCLCVHIYTCMQIDIALVFGVGKESKRNIIKKSIQGILKSS